MTDLEPFSSVFTHRCVVLNKTKSCLQACLPYRLGLRNWLKIWHPGLADPVPLANSCKLFFSPYNLQARAEELAEDLASLQTLCRDVEQHSEQMHARLSHKLQGELQVGHNRTAALICSGLRQRHGPHKGTGLTASKLAGCR